MKKIEMKTMKDYQDLHLKCDVLFLVDVFGKFRNNNLKNYRLSPSHLLSVPGLMQCFKRQKSNLNLFQILTCKYSSKKVQEVEFIIFLIDTAKRTISI